MFARPHRRRPAPLLLTALALGAFALLSLAAPHGAQAQTPAEVAKVLKKFDNEPTINEVQAAAKKFALIDEGQMEGWYTRAKIANLVPGEWTGQVEITEDNDENERTREELVRTNPDDFNSPLDIEEIQSTNDEGMDERIRYRLQADWDVHELIFNPDELRVAREVSRLVKAREQILITVTKLYYERRRLQVEALLRPATDTTEQVKMQLRIDELTADIDALTGGWFSKNIR